MQQKQKRRDTIFVAGTTGAGKTFFMNSLLLDYPRVILFSPFEAEGEEYHGVLFDEYDELIEHIQRKVEDEGPRCAFRVKFSDARYFDALCGFSYNLGYLTGGLMFCTEEAQRVIPARQPLSPEFADLLYRGRHPQVSLAVISQRFSTVSIEARSQWQRIISFRQTEPADINWLQNSTGYDCEGVRDLKQGEYYDVTTSGLMIHRKGKGV